MKKKSGLRHFLDAHKQIIDHWVFDSIRDRIHAETLWDLNRRSFAGGLAAGLFAAFIPFPMQMLIAAILAILWKANIPVALVSTWISNPLTYGPIFYLNYKVGLLILQLFYPITEPSLEPHNWLGHIQNLGAPFFVGSICVATVVSLVGYVCARGFWRLITIRKLSQRKHWRIMKRLAKSKKN